MQKAYFDSQEGVSQPDVDSEATEAEWKLFQQLIFIHYKRELNISSIIKANLSW